jgi:hypothetical protein
MKKQADARKPLLLLCQMSADFNLAEKNRYKIYKINIGNIGPQNYAFISQLQTEKYRIL